MKSKKKILSAVAVLALSAVTACAAFAGCKPKDDNPENPNDPGTAYNEYGTTYYVSPTGKTNGTGAKNDPMEISRLLGGNILKPGDTVLVMPGIYKPAAKIQVRSSGTYNHNITIKNASTTGEKAILDFSAMNFLGSNRGIELYADYVYWYGIDICGAGDNGMYIGGSYNTIEYCEFYNNRDTGLQIGRQESAHETIDLWPSYNLVKNCTSHNNYDNETYGENADGFAAKLTVGYGNVFDGCIAYRNSDDGWDLYAKSESGNIGQVIMYNCVAFENGYIEYTQAEYNALFRNFNKDYEEDETNSYMTRNGDGNGFKLGGSVMVGDVIMENCLSFNNRMHGVTDNSNPGYLYIDGVTSYNNSAAIDNDPESPNFGNLAVKANEDEHNNIDFARQDYSYNTVKNSLSVTDAYAKSLGKDEYRGSVYNSVLLGGSKANVIDGSIDADTKTGENVYTSQADALVSSDVFEKLPFTVADGKYTFNIVGLEDLGAGYNGGAPTNAERIHHKYRNADGSVNMGSILAVKDYGKLLGDSKKIGSQLNKSSWKDYNHFTEGTMPAEVKNSIAATLAKAKETLYINTDLDNCYQNFTIPTKFNLCSVSWTSSDESILKIGADYKNSLSASEYVTVELNKPEKDTKVKLTATISLFGRSVTKEFEINVKADKPSVGKLSVLVGSTGEVIQNNGTIIFDQYHKFEEPTLQVVNGAYKELEYKVPVNKLLTDDQYTVETKYEYAKRDGDGYKTVAGYSSNVDGVYRITHTVTLKDDPTSQNTMSYKIFVANTNAELDWAGEGAVKVNRFGFVISGNPNSAIGHIYTMTSTEDKTVTADDFYTVGEEGGKPTYTVKTGVTDNAFRATSISYQYENANSAEYYIYYALGNGTGVITSEVYKEKISVVNISTADQLKNIATGGKIGSEAPEKTIYKLTDCLDLAGKEWAASKEFKGVLNGDGHTLSNWNKGNALFNKVEGGSIMNVKFDNFTINAGSNNKIGIVSTCYGGYFYNIQINNIDIRGGQAVGGLIGQIYENEPTYIERISVSNDKEKVSAIDSEQTIRISGSTNSVGGIVGLIQTNGTPVSETFNVYISNCYSNVNVGTERYNGGIVGRYDSQKANVSYELTITNCFSAGEMHSNYDSAGGIIGGQQGNGATKLDSCQFVGKLYFKSAEPLEDSVKSCSGMFGWFIATAPVEVTNCLSNIIEYNELYQDGVLIRRTFNSKELLSGLFSDEVWNFHLVDGSDDELEAPYISLKFEACAGHAAAE